MKQLLGRGAFFALLAGLCVNLTGEPQVVLTESWSKAKVRTLKNSQAVVEDKLAQGGKALQVNRDMTGRRHLFIAKTPELAGKVEIKIYARAKGLVSLNKGLAVKARFKDLKTNEVFEENSLIQGARFTDKKYDVLPFTIDLGKAPAKYEFALKASWMEPEHKEKPVVWIEKVELVANGKNLPYISRIECDKNAYMPGQEVKAELTVVNPTDKDFEGEAVFEELYGLTEKREAEAEDIEVPAGQTKTFTVDWDAQKPEAGRQLKVDLKDEAEKVISSDSTYYGVAKDPSFLAVISRATEEHGPAYAHSQFYVGPSSYTLVKSAVEYFKKRKVQRMEQFSWTYNELAQMMPPEDEEPYLGNEGIWWQSLKKFKTQNKMLNDIGIYRVTYINGHCWGPAAYKLFQQHPDWFIYTKDGETVSYNMENRAAYERRNEFDFKQFKTPFFYSCFDHTNPEVQKYIANQIVTASKAQGFKGARWDVMSMDVKPTMYDIYGKPLAKDWKEADKKWSESIAAIKELVAEEIPDFTWGYNYCSPEENAETPLVLKEKCKDGGWMLDEVVCNFQSKVSPYHYWEAYRDYMCEWGDKIRGLGGIYNPFAFRRSGGKYPVDRLYEVIFRYLGSGRPQGYGYSCNSSKAGRLDLLVFRYSNIYLGWNLKLLPKDQKLVNVKAPETLWWKNQVFSNIGMDGNKQVIVQLVNSPISKEVEENPDSIMRPPVKDVKVSCGAEDGKLPKKAWLVCAEPLTPSGEPQVKAVPLKIERSGSEASVTVPYVIYWKTVVFEY
jgi:hypothetical protein